MEYPKMVKPGLIQLLPSISASALCINCLSEQVTIRGYLFQGIHVLLDCTCERCATSFYHTLGIAHDAMFPIAFTKDGERTQYDGKAEVWLARPLLDSMFKDSQLMAGINKKILTECSDKVMLLNCLDDCFGHAYAKLLNAQSLLEAYPAYSLIILISKNMEWLAPKGVSEIWIVDGTMSEMKKYITTLQPFVQSELNRFSECYLPFTKVFHDTQKVDVELFVKTSRFDLTRFSNRSPMVTFVLREDRFWHPNRFEEFLNRGLVKLKLQKYVRKFFVYRQNRLVRRTIKLVERHNSTIAFNLTGIGRKSGYPSYVNDLRSLQPTEEIELNWCELYSRSHIIVGVHGSNMLIPTSLAAGFIELLPDYKIPHIGEDTFQHYSGRYATYLARHVDAFITPLLLSYHIDSMLRFGEVFKQVERSA